jgi:hypothetical protein
MSIPLLFLSKIGLHKTQKNFQDSKSWDKDSNPQRDKKNQKSRDFDSMVKKAGWGDKKIKKIKTQI